MINHWMSGHPILTQTYHGWAVGILGKGWRLVNMLMTETYEFI
jgi:hypothetical protein